MNTHWQTYALKSTYSRFRSNENRHSFTHTHERTNEISRGKNNNKYIYTTHSPPPAPCYEFRLRHAYSLLRAHTHHQIKANTEHNTNATTKKFNYNFFYSCFFYFSVYRVGTERERARATTPNERTWAQIESSRKLMNVKHKMRIIHEGTAMTAATAPAPLAAAHTAQHTRHRPTDPNEINEEKIQKENTSSLISMGGRAQDMAGKLCSHRLL